MRLAGKQRYNLAKNPYVEDKNKMKKHSADAGLEATRLAIATRLFTA